MNARRAFATLLLGLVPFAFARASLAQTPAAASFGAEPNRDLVVPSFTDADVARILSTLDARLAASPSDRGDDEGTLWEFGRSTQMARLSGAQESTILGHLTDLARTHPSQADALATAAHTVRDLTIGKTAPDIVGTDLQGQPLRLSDYRGKVVALLFSGEWCGICRSDYPYERFLGELYKTWPFALLVVNSDPSAEAAQRAYAGQQLPVRAWFDGGGPHGPIASAWNVKGWPAVYVLDERGVIRFVNLRQEDLLKGVRQLLLEQAQAAARRPSR